MQNVWVGINNILILIGQDDCDDCQSMQCRYSVDITVLTVLMGYGGV